MANLKVSRMTVSVHHRYKTKRVSQLLPRLGWDGRNNAVEAWRHQDLGIGDCQDDKDENQQAL